MTRHLIVWGLPIVKCCEVAAQSADQGGVEEAQLLGREELECIRLPSFGHTFTVRQVREGCISRGHD